MMRGNGTAVLLALLPVAVWGLYGWYRLPEGADMWLFAADRLPAALLVLGVFAVYAELRRRRRQTMLLRWLAEVNSAEMVQIRHHLYASEGEASLPLEAASRACGCYEGWGLLCRQRVLPLRSFSGSAGFSVVRLYAVLRPFIREMRTAHNPAYAENFEWLAREVRRKYKRKVGTLLHDADRKDA